MRRTIMEYGEAINSGAAERALAIACRKIADGAKDLRRVAAEAVTEAYCVCVVAGEDAVEGTLSAIHADLIESLNARLCGAAREQN
jgi:hypothetical protein